ncbi:aldo keto reductase [Brachionus plicatilis]|uniref:Aldo keto reductase n=1 Tax=Brachionus plicatilis TaxID=10195 RepID=A0A3M7SI49_BRAPC|nr:aldo keto reductase [Brachionus plicatilis]
MQFKTLSSTGIKISAIGLGAMPLSLSRRPPEDKAIQVIHRALDLGVNFIDTADSYCLDENDKHHNEKLITKALETYKGDFGSSVGSVQEVIVATKGGLLRPNGDWTVHGEPNHIRRTIKESFEALGGFYPIPLWQLHAVDPKYPLESTFVPIKEAVDMGLIKHVGVSNFSVEQIERAMKIVPIVSVQNQHNPWHRNPEFDGVLEFCEKKNLIFLPWSPVGGGYRYKQLLNVKPLNDLASAKNCTVYSLILAWLRQKSPCVVPIPGASRNSSIEDSVSSLNVVITQQEMKIC